MTLYQQQFYGVAAAVFGNTSTFDALIFYLCYTAAAPSQKQTEPDHHKAAFDHCCEVIIIYCLLLRSTLHFLCAFECTCLHVCICAFALIPICFSHSETFSFMLTGEDGSRRFGYCRRLLVSHRSHPAEPCLLWQTFLFEHVMPFSCRATDAIIHRGSWKEIIWDFIKHENVGKWMEQQYQYEGTDTFLITVLVFWNEMQNNLDSLPCLDGKLYCLL